MAAIRPRLYWDNLVLKTETAIIGSSQEPNRPAIRIADERRSKVWQSRLGFNIVEGVNDSMDIDEGTSGTFTAFFTPGNYSSGAAMAAHLETQINTVAVDNTYTVTYSAITRKFTIARNVGADTFDLLTNTGPTAPTAFYADAGFDVSADQTALLSYTGANPVQRSAEWILFDAGAPVAADAALVAESNVSSPGLLKIQGNATDDFSAPAFEAVLAAGDARDTSKLLNFFSAAETWQFWRILDEDRDNGDGFAQLGVAFIGPQQVFERTYGLGEPESHTELSVITEGDQGAIFTDVKPSRFEREFRFPETSDADKLAWELVADDRKAGMHLWYALDPLNFPLTRTLYGFVDTPGIRFQHQRSFTDPTAPPVASWNVSFPFREGIG